MGGNVASLSMSWSMGKVVFRANLSIFPKFTVRLSAFSSSV